MCFCGNIAQTTRVIQYRGDFTLRVSSKTSLTQFILRDWDRYENEIVDLLSIKHNTQSIQFEISPLALSIAWASAWRLKLSIVFTKHTVANGRRYNFYGPSTMPTCICQIWAHNFRGIKWIDIEWGTYLRINLTTRQKLKWLSLFWIFFEHSMQYCFDSALHVRQKALHKTAPRWKCDNLSAMPRRKIIYGPINCWKTTAKKKKKVLSVSNLFCFAQFASYSRCYIAQSTSVYHAIRTHSIKHIQHKVHQTIYTHIGSNSTHLCQKILFTFKAVKPLHANNEYYMRTIANKSTHTHTQLQICMYKYMYMCLYNANMLFSPHMESNNVWKCDVNEVESQSQLGATHMAASQVR